MTLASRFGILGVLLMAMPVSAADTIDFNRDVRPILSEHCFQCHGFDAKARKARLRLDTSEGAYAKREQGHPVVPGKLDKSLVWERLIAKDPEAVMPPPSTKKTLTAEQKEIIKRWIEEGGKYQKHWSFEAIARPEVPANIKNPIDYFIQRKLLVSGLTQQPEADRSTLIRRVAFSLTGLPPTVKEVDTYLNDRAEGAYERMVDRYLASPRYGEEMGRHWLDVARYADTHGLHLDNERTMWLYRDWVVKAFNQNLPFDQFTVWQVAGDLLPNPTADQLVATGFNRCNVTTSEGGSIAEEFVYRYAVERTTAVAEAWLGLTAGCAVCHDHKYDPISSNEFYSMYAFFNNAADPAMDGNVSNTTPFYRAMSASQKATLDAATALENQAKKALDEVVASAYYVDPADSDMRPYRKTIRDLIFDDVLPPGASSSCSSRNPTLWLTDPDFGTGSGRRVIRQGSPVTYRDTFRFPLKPIVVPENGAFEVQVRIDPKEVPTSLVFSVDGAPRGKNANGSKSVSWTRTERGLIKDKSKDAPLPTGEWVKLRVSAQELGLSAGHWVKTVALAQNGGLAFWDRLELVGEVDPETDPRESFQAWRKLLGSTPPGEMPGDLQAIVKAGDKAKPEEITKLRRYYLEEIVRPSDDLSAPRRTWEQARSARIVFEESVPGTFIFRDRDGKPRDSFVMLRGQYNKPGEKVVPDVPAILPGLHRTNKTERANRLDLAKWLVSKENPLTARVTVNRLWQQFFGTGLVKTSYDFGSQGEPPTHPELLDWLASEFRDQGWDTKKFVRMLLLSDTFRQQSVVTADAKTKDPENRYYAHGPRFRLDAEQVRDNVLFVSGLIDLSIGGRGVNPYQPANIWEPVGYSDSNTRYFQQDHGRDLYRRSMYVFLKRTAPPPFMANFDGPNREQVCTARERSNTPLQALQMMNDVQHFEAARALAERVMLEGGTTRDDQVSFLYRVVLSRKPEIEERLVVLRALEKQRDLYHADPVAATKAIHVGESQPRVTGKDSDLAAWTMIANLVLNLDETVNRN